MGVSENLFGTQCIALTYQRPFPQGVPGEILRDFYTGILYRWSATDGTWIPFASTEQPVTLYVDPLGNDADEGSAAFPLATPQEAVRRLPPEIRHVVLIDINDNAGASFVYGEALVVDQFQIFPNGSIRFLGRTRPAVLLSGPNVVAAAPANFGDDRSLTVVPNPGWTPGDLVGRMARFTVGPHTFWDTCAIIANTNDTIYFGANPQGFLGPYGPADGFDILDITTIIQETNPFGMGSLYVQNNSLDNEYGNPITGAAASTLVFEDLRFDQDPFIGICALFAGSSQTTFLQCVLHGYLFDVRPTGGQLSFIQCGIYHFDRQWASTPSNNGTKSFFNTGIVGSMDLGQSSAGASYTQLMSCNWIPDYTSADYALMHFEGGRIDIGRCWIDGGGMYTPVCIHGDRSFGTMVINASVIIEGSPTSGIDGNFPANTRPWENGVGSCSILLTNTGMMVGEFLPDIRNNAFYGIDLTGPYRLISYDQAQSTIPNLLGGCRCRRGAHIQVRGILGQVPTICGPAGTDQVDMDDRTPPWFWLWGDEVTGLETLCQMWPDQSRPM